jgi:CDP-diacylglycerol--serine O-phosphatidyltransferase
MKISRHIPNFITSMNLFAGSIAVYYAFQGDFLVVFIAVLLAAIFDFMDGFAARLLKAYSPMGKELDSLADAISFGLAPGAVAFSLLAQSDLPGWVSFVGFLIPVFSALRLAKFNIDERQSENFIGMPTPANAIFWVGISYSFSPLFIENPWITLVAILILSGLLVSEIPMISLKFNRLAWKGNQGRYIFLAGSLILLIIFRQHAFGIIILWYLANALIGNAGKHLN